jgi:predicted cupin superfamily sugar epimerase
MLTADQIRALLKLEPHPIEGGYFVETYQSALRIPKASCCRKTIRATGPPAPLSITCLRRTRFPPCTSCPATKYSISTWVIRLKCCNCIPTDGEKSQCSGKTSPRACGRSTSCRGGVWQGSRLRPGGSYALLGTTMSPGFDYKDYETGSRETLTKLYPKHSSLIASLTR